jgi:prephenate dehydratase
MLMGAPMREKTKPQLAYLGPRGTYSHMAALAAVREMGLADEGDVAAANRAVIECATIGEVFDLVDRGRVPYGVVPIENALEGSVNETLDAFAFSSGALILRELVLDIHHNLIVAPGTRLGDIRNVASHPQALAQCRRWLARNLPNAVTTATTSTAEAVRLLRSGGPLANVDDPAAPASNPAASAGDSPVASSSNPVAGTGDPGSAAALGVDLRAVAQVASAATSQVAAQVAAGAAVGVDPRSVTDAAAAPQVATQAAIGTALAAELFGAAVLEEQIEDHFGNQTRFVVMGARMPRPSGNDKTSLALFMKEDRPGTLLMILAEFAYAGLNLTKIQSRPTKRALGDYMFWIDVEGHADDLSLKTALDSLRLKMREVKLLGSYPVALTEGDE